MRDDPSGPTIAANRDRAYPEIYILRAEADAKAFRAYWRGVFTGAVGLALILSLAAVVT